MIGTHVRDLIIKRDSLLLRVGGGYNSVNNFIQKEAKLECNKILLQIESEQRSFSDVMCTMMASNGASPAVIA